MSEVVLYMKYMEAAPENIFYIGYLAAEVDDQLQVLWDPGQRHALR